MDDLVTVAIGLFGGHPAVTSVKFAGSRSRGTHELLSDWDFAVETSDFETLARDLPALVESRLPLRSRTPTPHRFIELAKIRTAPLPMYSNPPAKLQRIGQFITHHEDVFRGHRSFYLEAPRRIASLEACLVPSRPDALRDAEDSASRRPRPEYAGKGNALPEGLVALCNHPEYGMSVHVAPLIASCRL